MEVLDSVTGASSPEATAATGTRVLVYVHGIGAHPAHYSDPWWHALHPHVSLFGNGGLGDTRFEVLWSDITDQANLSKFGITDDPARSPQADTLRLLINAQIAERTLEDAELSGEASTPEVKAFRASPREYILSRGEADIDDFLRYMLDDKIREKVIHRFTSVVRPLLKAGNTVDIISHSWGTVVAFDGLRQLSANLPGRVHDFFTVGSALSFWAVRFGLGLPNLKPALVNKWINLNARGDVIGGSLRDDFPVNKEYLDLDPTGCSRNPLGYDPGCAHSSYFQAHNIAVNRDIFAFHLNRT